MPPICEAFMNFALSNRGVSFAIEASFKRGTTSMDDQMTDEQTQAKAGRPQVVYRAREVLVAFLFTFIAARILVYLIMSRWIHDLYLHMGGTHVHHLNYGIFILSFVGGYLI